MMKRFHVSFLLLLVCACFSAAQEYKTSYSIQNQWLKSVIDVGGGSSLKDLKHKEHSFFSVFEEETNSLPHGKSLNHLCLG